jgi:putative cell wall-binding protein
MASLLSTSARTLSKGATTSTPKPDESPVLQAAAEVPAVITWKRLAGASRYSTMSAIVSEGFGDSDWAIVASGSNFPDALVASALAGAYDCPIIITDPNELSTEAANQLLRMDVDYVFIMGGTSAVSEDVELGIEELGIMTYRVSGSSRLETSVRALGEVRDAGSTSNTIIVASGTKYADALSIGPWAYLKKAPIILAGSNGLLTDEEVEAIQSDEYVTQILIVGGPSAVSRSIRDQLGDQFGYKRLEGEDRFETNREVMAWTADNGLSWTQPAVASGANYPDALVGAAFSGSKGSVLALNHSSTIGMITAHKSSVMRGYILGGKSAVASVNGVTSTDTLDGVDIS